MHHATTLFIGPLNVAPLKSAKAEKAFRADLDRNPRNGRSLFGLWQSLLAQKKGADADWVRREFMTAWKAADTQLRIENL